MKLHSYADIARYLAEHGFEPMDGGINWTWANFPTDADAHAFHAALGPEWETRGVYEAQPDSPNPNLHKAGVRFR